MKRENLLVSVALGTSLFFATSANAALIDRGGGLIYDTDLNITWLQDANYGAGSIYDSIDGSTDGRMRWWNAVPWAENLSYYDSVRNITYDDWRLPTTGPVNGTSMTYLCKEDGSTDCGWNVSAPGSASAGNKGSEMAYLFFNSLGNKAYYDTLGNGPQPGWGLVNTGPFVNLQSGAYWSGSHPPEAWGTDAAWFFVFGSAIQAGGIWDTDVGSQWIFSRDSRIHVMAVRDGDVAAITPVAEPETYAMLLAGLGLLGFTARRRKNA